MVGGGIELIERGGGTSYLGRSKGAYDFGGLLDQLRSSWRWWWNYERAGHCGRLQ